MGCAPTGDCIHSKGTGLGRAEAVEAQCARICSDIQMCGALHPPITDTCFGLGCDYNHSLILCAENADSEVFGKLKNTKCNTWQYEWLDAGAFLSFRLKRRCAHHSWPEQSSSSSSSSPHPCWGPYMLEHVRLI